MSTDSEEIADVARAHGGDVPFLRPAALASDSAPMWPVLRHALDFVEKEEGREYTFVVLLDPTSPPRLPEDIEACIGRLNEVPEADGIVAVSRPEFNPLWLCVVERDGWMEDLNPGASSFARRQDVPVVFRINATLYVWRASFMKREARDWRGPGRHLLHEIPEARAVHIDDADEFAKAEALIGAGLLRLPWLSAGKSGGTSG